MGKLTRKLSDEHILFILKLNACNTSTLECVKKLREYYGVSLTPHRIHALKHSKQWGFVYDRFRIEYINDILASHKLICDKSSRYDVAIELLEQHRIDTPNSDERKRIDNALICLEVNDGVEGNTITSNC